MNQLAAIAGPLAKAGTEIILVIVLLISLAIAFIFLGVFTILGLALFLVGLFLIFKTKRPDKRSIALMVAGFIVIVLSFIGIF